MDNITKIAEMLSEQIKQELATEYSLSDVEIATRLLVQEIGRRAIAMVVNSEEKLHPAPEVSCPDCGQEIPRVRRRSAQLRTIFGCLQVKRAYYLCPECHQGCCPLDRRLGLRPNAISAELERLGAMTGTLLPFGKGRDLFETLILVSLSGPPRHPATDMAVVPCLQRHYVSTCTTSCKL